MAAFSPHRDGGGTLHFPSPTHIHRADPSAALASLRRSLSRSPSKGPTFRLVTSKSISPSPGSPHTPSPLSPQGRRRSADLLSNSSVISPSPLATPFPPSARRSRSSARKLSPPRPITVASGTQRSPVKRGLSDSIHNGNATPPSPIGTGIGTENISPSGSPEDKVEAKTTLTGIGTSDDLLSPHHALVRFDRASGYFANSAAKSSPLKRSDGIMNLDMTSLDSPSAKRRSLHGASFSPDFDIFDHEAAMQSQANSDMPNDIEAPFSQPQTFYEHPSVLSKRTSSLRKTTLQQRYEKPFLGRLKPSTDLSHGLNTPGLPSSKSRPRMSLDNVFPQTTRDSPFSSQGSLPNASVHPISHQHREHQALVPPTIAQRHPLSRTITQSLAGSSAAEDSPTHIPHRHPDSRRPSVDFTKSLPLGAARPSTRAPVSREFTVQPSSTGTPFSTPESYKLAKPLPAAFMSTGLISKRNKDIHPEQLDMNASVASMPDTPCKRSSLNNVVPKPAPKNMVKPRHKHQSMHSFGTPSTPFNPHITRPSLGSFAKGVSIFGSGFGNRGLTRRASFLSTDGDEISASSLGVNIDSQSSTDMDVPPTPTRQAIVSTWAQQSAFGQNAFSPQVAANVEAPSFSGFESPRPERCSKSTSTHSPGVNAEEGSDGCLEDSPSTSLRFRSINAVSSFSKRPNLMKHARSPTLLSRSSLSVPLICTRNTKAKPSPLSPASPLFSEIEQNSPHTPQGNVHPPDPSGLSISVRGDGSDIECFTNVSYGSPLVLPATPTSTRDQISRFGKSRASMTPIHNPAPIELDTSLLSRFGKVEVIGTGEFSQVYRVTQKPESKLYQGFFTVSSVQEPSHTPLPNQVWAVKRSRQPFIGPKDRNRKLQEVEVLKALGRSDHTVELFGSWENKDHLYIQTEFCEEGSLDLFLDQVGRKARLDNFRIWKIMLELSLVGNFGLHGRLTY